MHLDFRVQGTDLRNAVRDYVTRRLRFALNRFYGRVGRVTVRLKGEMEKCCYLNVEMLPTGNVMVQETHPDLFVAIDHATERLSRAFGRQVQRIRHVAGDRLTIRDGYDLRRTLHVNAR